MNNGNSRPRTVRVVVDGTPREAWEGQSVTAVLAAAGIWALRRNPVTGQARGPFCGMGVCLECEVTIDGRADVRSCLAHVADGMDIRTLADAGAPPHEEASHA
ncbi:(2Fe-2S)-binding protein [Streptomyces sp. NBC_01803]|uniref:(2Fe-2S)-binding protein n=1 Tax=Streptomyces sp. NBC_01803 TaxID=2975946 RepID=UPI002DDC6E91|nr:(2Fe-2S)-binding protein [Streptomyces sp. NBC_01803]WSA43297.1 (2Fe-2S)-binding protein [Streptomyces sp. NBC_01803]